MRAKHYWTISAVALFLAGMFCSCMRTGGGSVDCEVYGEAETGVSICRYTLKKGDLKVRLTNLGGTLLGLEVPDRGGHMENIVRGHISLDDYARSTASPNAVIGRGPRGEKLDKVIWDVELLKEPDAVGVRLRFPGMHGAPGVKQASDLKNIVVTYWLNDDNEFEIVYEYVAGGIAPEGVTHNIYFSLCGTDGDGALDHQLAIAADNFYPVDKDQTLFGSHRSVRDTPFDFLNPERIGARISSDDEQLQFGDGYNHCWTLNGGDDGDVVATIFDPQSGRYMEIMTPNPCLQFSSARPEDKLRPDNRGFCIKAQLPPGESVKAGELVRLRTVYHFSTL